MKKIILSICLSLAIISIGTSGRTSENTQNRLAVMKLIDQISTSFPAIKACIVSPDGNHVIYVAGNDKKSLVIYNGREGNQYDKILSGTPIFSPDSHSIAYVARKGNRWFAVLNGKEGKTYDSILEGTLTFSQDSEHLAYIAKVGNDYQAVIDGKEGSKYHSNVTIEIDRGFYNAPNRFHYFVIDGHNLYYVEETLI